MLPIVLTHQVKFSFTKSVLRTAVSMNPATNVSDQEIFIMVLSAIQQV